MIDYATWCAIRDGAARHLTPAQLAEELANTYYRIARLQGSASSRTTCAWFARVRAKRF